MESNQRAYRIHPSESASFLSVIFFSWTWLIYRNDRRKQLNLGDIWSPVSKQSSILLGDRLEKCWKDSLKKNKHPSLLMTLLKTFKKEFIYLAILHLFLQLLDILLRPYFLRMMLLSFAMENDNGTQLLYAALGLISTSAVSVLFANHYNLNSFELGLYLRAACISVVYRKSLRLSRTALGDTSPGHIVNLVSNDVSRFEILALLFHFMWSAPLVTLIVGGFLWVECGVAAFAGLLVIFSVLPIQTITAKLTSKYRLQTAFKTDERIRCVDEVIAGISVIKMYAWEKPFIKLLEMCRKVELAVIRKTGLLRGLYMTFNIFTTRCAVASTLITYSLIGNPLKADKVFVVAAYFGIMSLAMSTMFVRGFAELAECKVSIGRIQNFLLHDEVDTLKSKSKEEKSVVNGDAKTNKTDLPSMPNGIPKERRKSIVVDTIIAEEELPCDTKPLRKISSTVGVSLKNVNASWIKNTSDSILVNINLSCQSGSLLGIIGSVGSGKSSLLQLILGEMSVTSGDIKVSGELSYAAQEAWVFAGTIRQNILFGLPFERKRYREVIKACSLERDIELFSLGDLTIVGERGSSLSGGQKARINLARAVYRQADIYLLDDPLSAVDTHVSKHIFKYCLRGFLRGKTILLATHQTQFTKNMDRIIVMEHGSITQEGNHEEIMEFPLKEKPKEPSDGSSLNLSAPKPPPSLMRMVSIKSSRSVSSAGDDISLRSFQDFEEEQNSGETHTKYSGNIYWGYMKAAGSSGVALFGLVIFFFVTTQTLASLTDFWMSYWTVQEEKYNQITDDWFKIVYGSLVIVLFFTALLRGLTFYLGCTQASSGLHTIIINKVLSTDLSFFMKNHSGGILNRFSKDLGGTDESLPKFLLDCGQVFGQVIGAMVTSSIVNFWFMIPVTVFTTLTIIIRNICIKTTKNMKRIENMARSPVYSHLNASLQGLVTIRALDAERFLNQEFDSHQDLHTSTLYTYLALQQGYAFFLDVFGIVYLSLVIMSFVISQTGMSGSDVGLAITQTMTMTAMLQWGMRGSAELANLMTSVERLLGYTQLPDEETDVMKIQIPQDWPSQGLIEMKDLYMWYDKNDAPSLRNLNLRIESREKVGIVGRTGAGKSSLITALFRLSHLDGSIYIDNVDTSTVSLATLRSRISIIPQDPVLFSGTIRKNLDPFNDYPDYLLWRALEEVEMKETLTEGGLDTRVSDGGGNLSVGQRQLICLARAIVRNNRIIVLDEATANVDPKTDGLIQSTIRNRFNNCTVLTVAHRLQTVIDSDRIIVMDAGNVVEFDEPYKLLQQKGGYFYHLVHESGKAMADQLTEIAQKVYERKHQIGESVSSSADS